MVETKGGWKFGLLSVALLIGAMISLAEGNRLPNPGYAVMLFGMFAWLGSLMLAALVTRLGVAVRGADPYGAIIMGRVLVWITGFAGALVLLGALRAIDVLPFHWGDAATQVPPLPSPPPEG